MRGDRCDPGCTRDRWFGNASPEDALHAPAQVRGLVADEVLSISHREVTAHQRERHLSVETTCRRSRRDGDRSHGVPARRQETPGQRRSEAYAALHGSTSGNRSSTPDHIWKTQRKPQVRGPLQQAPKSPRTPRGASSQTCRAKTGERKPQVRDLLDTKRAQDQCALRARWALRAMPGARPKAR